MDLLVFEAEEQPKPNADVEEVTNYLDALAYAREQLASKRGLPLSLRLLNEAHKRLMRGVRGESKQPGDIRRSQHWIGGSRPGNAVYVPPPADKLPPLLSSLSRNTSMPTMGCRNSSGRASCMRSSNRSTPTSMATGGSDAY